VLKFEVTSPGGTHQLHVGGLFLRMYDPATPPLSGLLPGLWLDATDGYVIIVGVPPTGWNFQITLPPGALGAMLRWQTMMLTPNPVNGLFALSDAYDFYEN
jgi:hypothetical protein